jgi:hypothetical protein
MDDTDGFEDRAGNRRKSLRLTQDSKGGKKRETVRDVAVGLASRKPDGWAANSASAFGMG